MASGYPDWSRSLVVWDGTKWVRFGGESAGVYSLCQGWDGAAWQKLQVDADYSLKVALHSFTEPSSAQSIITIADEHAAAGAAAWTIHTVTAGKTLYITDIFFNTATQGDYMIRLQDGATVVGYFKPTHGSVITDSTFQAHLKTPIAWAAASEVKLSVDNRGEGAVTLNTTLIGWES